MKMHPIIFKQGNAVIVTFCFNICLLFKNPVTAILKVVGYEDCVQENVSYRYGGGGGLVEKLQLLCNSCNFFFGKKQPF